MIEVEKVMEGRIARTEQIAREEFGALAQSYEIDNFESFMVPDGAPSASTNKTSFNFINGEGLVPTNGKRRLGPVYRD
jgi:hypothetical protein